jgi:integrase
LSASGIANATDKLAGLDYGRSKGLTWHTIRHEFVSRNIENTGDPVVTQRLARHKDGRTTQGYMHACARVARHGGSRSTEPVTGLAPLPCF